MRPSPPPDPARPPELGALPVGAISPRRRLQAVLFDRDGTLVHDVPYNGDPESVQPLAGAAAAVATARGAGWRVGMVTNQRAVALGLVTADDVRAVNARVEAQLGPFDGVAWCPHDVDDRCRCRKPAPGMILDLAAQWGIDPATCVVIGDTAADLGAAAAAGALGILVPNEATAADEVATAPLVATTLLAAVQLALHLAHVASPASDTGPARPAPTFGSPP